METIKEAGAIVFRTDGGLPRVLLVRAKRHPDEWIFPKGHVKAGESFPAAAIREAAEEAGVTGVVIGRAGSSPTFWTGSESVSVEYYLIHMTGEVPPSEQREKIWCSFNEALTRLAHSDARELLSAVMPVIEQRAAAESGH